MQFPPQQFGDRPVHGGAAQAPQLFGSVFKFVQLPAQHVEAEGPHLMRRWISDWAPVIGILRVSWLTVTLHDPQ